jgi:hypothetical protein
MIVISGLSFRFSKTADICLCLVSVAGLVSQIKVFARVFSAKGERDDMFDFPFLLRMNLLTTDMTLAISRIEYLHSFFF